MIEKLGTCASLHGNNDFAERTKVLLDVDPKIILLEP